MLRVLLLLLTGTLAAAEPTPREQILALVPPESAVCFVVQNLRTQAKTVANSPFAAWATQKFAAALGENNDAKKLKEVEEFVTAIIGLSPQDLRDDILGDVLAFAYEPGPAGQPQDERGVVLLYARDPAKLKTLIDKLNAFQKTAGELKSLVEVKHNGRTYIHRNRGEAASEFYLLHGHLFAFAAQEKAIQAIIDRTVESKTSPVLKDLNDLKLQNAFLACWLNPRKLDADLQPQAGASDAEKAGRAQVAKLWGAVDRCAIYLTADSDAEIGLAVQYRSAAVPAELRSAFADVPQASQLWGSMPDDAILAIAGNVEANALLETIASFLPPGDRPELRRSLEKELGAIVGKDKLPVLLAALGSDVGLWAEKTAKDGSPLPGITTALRIRTDEKVNVPALALKIVDFYARILQYDYNRKHDDQITLVEVKLDGLSVTTLANDVLFPKGVEPAFAITNGFLVVASNTALVTKFKAPAKPGTTGDVPLAKLSAASMREHLALHRDGLAAFLASKQAREESTIRGEIDNLAQVLEAFESLEIVVRGDASSRTFALKARMIKPLK